MTNNTDLLNYAQYSVMVATNSVTDEVRNAYFSVLQDSRDSCAEAFNSILMSVFKGIENKHIDAETAKVLVENEYNNSCLHDIFGDYSPLSVLINNVIDVKASAKNINSLDEFKSYINIADTLDKDFAISVYYIILSKMCFSNRVIEDLVFSKKLIDYINSYGSMESKFRILYDALGYVFLV